MSAFKTRNSTDIKIRANALKNGNEFAIMTFLELRKDDTCWKRFLRFFRIIPQQKI
jgi:hypothetical protein